jgi:hypothetical protein
MDSGLGDALEYVGKSPAATGGSAGWRMKRDLLAECPRCGELVSLDPDETASCGCGALHKDADAGRFGSVFRDESIRVFRRRTSA